VNRSVSTLRAVVRRATTVLVSAALIGAGVSSIAWAGGATVTSGDLHAFAAGVGMDISGHAVMVRTADGKTIVSVHIEGLAPSTTYGSHVHQAACTDNLADGHFRFDLAGPAMPPNEIWPGPFTTNPDGVGNANTMAGGAAGPEAVSVVVHAPDGSKIACADLA
jgi:hypothetical protein